ncbi:hypothetical protein FE257_005721 [Aspergillus nanangensis]|uniref:Linalool dehydratase/isomerase domain-containing protein n=1 Tax=Aspergillus nanangensis TaxID=2582783 RepID=A0AAD4GVE6_ASPNN|nr:hypothetical protein FE257_005721 [Aspergillus nanangensis]
MSTTTTTTTVLTGAQPRFPSQLPSSMADKFDKLTREQAGHLRHFHNLATGKPGEWIHMGGQEPGQEWLDAFRYQLATMAYATGAAHYHRLPQLRSVFQSLLAALIEKMLHRDVWGYWFLTSHSGKFVDPDIRELRKPWADPIVKENIMYSGHLLLMVSLYTMLFDDDRYNKPGALTFNWNPIFWGMGAESFSYTRQSLQQAILVEMERENWLGVCCEPNSIFVVCNQFPIVAIRYNDVRDGTGVVTDVLKRYSAAWESKGIKQENGLFVNFYSPKQGKLQKTRDIGSTAWTSAFMNSWNSELAGQTFPSQAAGFLSRVEADRVNLNASPVAHRIRDISSRQGADPFSRETFQEAFDYVQGPGAQEYPNEDLPFSRPTFGYVVKWVSEVGDEPTLSGLLNHADRYMQPTWSNGGLHYATNTTKCDPDGNWVEVDPFTGNGAIGYARLNVFNGQKKMWANPWTPEKVQTSPFLDGIDLSSGIDFLRGRWDEALKMMAVTMRTWDGSSKRANIQLRGLPIGQYGIYYNGALMRTGAVAESTSLIELGLEVAGQDLDLVVVHEEAFR